MNNQTGKLTKSPLHRLSKSPLHKCWINPKTKEKTKRVSEKTRIKEMKEKTE